MNAGRDVERLIAGWLEEEAAGRAPDRVLDGARRSITKTGQRRLVVAWREPMSVSPFRLAWLVAALAVAIGAAAWFGRITASSGVGASPTPTAIASPGVTLDAYRVARGEICARYGAQSNPLKAQLEGIYDPAITAEARAPKIAALTQIVSLGNQANAEIDALEAPSSIAIDVALANDRGRQQGTLLHQELDRLAVGDLAGAESLDKATDPLGRQIEEFLRQNRMDGCL